MKKSIIALIGLFTLVACSEDNYQEADKMNENSTGAVENTGPQNSIKTTGPFYESPYQPFSNNSANYGNTNMVFINNSPLHLKLEAFGGDLHQDMIPGAGSLSPLLSQPINIPAGANLFGGDCGGIISTVLPNPPGCPLDPSLAYDFGNVLDNWYMLHHGKIHFFKFEIQNSFGVVVKSGYIKQRFFGDGDLHTAITAKDGDWQPFGPVNGLPPNYDAYAMYHTGYGEICIAQDAAYTDVFESKIGITDPTTGINYTLEYYTNGPTGTPNSIIVSLM